MVIDYIFGVVGVYQTVTSTTTLSQIGWAIVFVLAFTIPPFIAFRTVKVARDKLQGKLDQKPKLEMLDIKDDKPFWEFDKHVGQESFWLRLGVKNSGISPATKCVGKIVKFRDSSNRQIGRDFIPLCWQGTYIGQLFLETGLNPCEEKYLDVLMQKEKSPNVAYFAAPRYGGIDELEQVPDNITRLVIAVYCAETKPIYTDFVIKWKDNTHCYQSLRIEKAGVDKEGSQT